MMEWTSQAHLEQYLELPTTVQTAGSPLAEANSQIFFISNFAMPLIQLMVEAIPGGYSSSCTCERSPDRPDFQKWSLTVLSARRTFTHGKHARSNSGMHPLQPLRLRPLARHLECQMDT